MKNTVSKFKNYKAVNKPVSVALLEWLVTDEYADQVKKIRSTNNGDERQRLKAMLPAITPSGVFTRRGEKHLAQHSGFMQFDIDKVGDAKKVKHILSTIPNIAYCGLSVSGNGLWGLVPIAYPDKHRQHFRALAAVFSNLGITLDKAPQNVASLRGASYDPDAYFNHNAEVFTPYKQVKRAKPYGRHSDQKVKVERYVNQIERECLDITGDYNQWLKIGFALADEFGERGREYYHRISRFYTAYSEGETDSKYDDCLCGDGEGVTIGTFYGLCNQSGLPERADFNPEPAGHIDASVNGSDSLKSILGDFY